jgi:methylenetetrahydrofolate dehydrogenase (NADP+) / methenyltetrahydrofolate cyclohydrolase
MIIDGRKIAEEYLDLLKSRISQPLSLGAVIIGDNPAVASFIKVKEIAAQKLGIEFKKLSLSSDESFENMAKKVKEFSSQVEGLFIELPISSEFPLQDILNLVPEEKDVDGLVSANQEKFHSGDFSLLPPAVAALQILLNHERINVKGKRIAVFGQGVLVGRPISHWLWQKGAQVSRIDINTENPAAYSKSADIIISGVGKPDLIKGAMIKESSIIIDFGFGMKGGKICGDVDFDSVKEKAAGVTPVPGGMGPLVVAALFENLILLNKKPA